MIAPRTILLYFSALGLLLGAVLYIVSPALLTATALVWTLLALVLLLDAVVSLGRLSGTGASFPEIVRLTKEREGSIPVLLHFTGTSRPLLEIGLALPAELPSPQETWRIAVAPGGTEARFDWPCTPRRRGRYQLQGIYLQAVSRLGFWHIRKHIDATAEVRVYPNLQQERSKLAAIFLNRGSFGMHAQRRVGKGRDFEQLREYIPGDSLQDIHWKATARRGHPVTKVYQLERTQEIYVVLDASRLSSRVFEDEAGRQVTQLERFLNAAMALGLVAEKQGDLFGLITFGEEVYQFLRAGNGIAHYNAVRDAVYALEARPVNPDFEELFTFIRLRLRRRALLMFLTNLDDPVLAESFAKQLRLISRRHLVLVNMVTSPEIRPLFAAPDAATPEDVYDRFAAHLQWRDLRELQQVLHREGVSMHLLENESLTPELVSQYAGVKQRQLL